MEHLKDVKATRGQPLLNAIFNLSVGLIENGNIKNLTEREVRIDNIYV